VQEITKLRQSLWLDIMNRSRTNLRCIVTPRLKILPHKILFCPMYILMKNVEMKLDGDILTIKVDVTKEFGPSSSGKTVIIASTEGNISIPDKDEIKIGLNVYKKKPVAV
jgi:hypothetical protein